MNNKLIMTTEEFLDVIKCHFELFINIISGINLTVLPILIEEEEVVVDCLEIVVNDGTDCTILENKIEYFTEHYIIKGNRIFIELTDLVDLLKEKTNANVTEIFDIVESNINGDFKECICFDIV